jgi:CheY-like chemotaxis protein
LQSLRLLLVGGNDYFLKGLAAWLLESTPLSVAGMARSAQEALDRAADLAPDAVLMDVTLSDMNGFAVSRALKARPASPLIVLMTLYVDDAVRSAAREAGADGCVSKPELTRDLLPLIEELLRARTRAAAEPRNAVPNTTPVESKTGHSRTRGESS